MTTTRKVAPCENCGSQPELSSRPRDGVLRFELSCKCGANVVRYLELGTDSDECVDLLTKRWNEVCGDLTYPGRVA